LEVVVSSTNRRGLQISSR